VSDSPIQRIEMSEAEILAVYDQGPQAVVTKVTTALAQINALVERVEQLTPLVAQVEALKAEVEELKGKARKNSRNSSKPPSSDGFGKRTKSLRGKSEKPSGGQPEHPGSTLEWQEADLEIEHHAVTTCSGCGASLSKVAAESTLCRQVFDIAPVQLVTVEHQSEIKQCPSCGCETIGSFPPEARNVVQYGPRLRAIMVYLMEGQLLPSARSCDVLKDLLGVRVSEATLYNVREQCYEQLEAVEQQIQAQVVSAEVVHFDETGLRVNGCLWWLHVASTSGMTYYFVHPKRGHLAMDEMGVLLNFKGNALHDGWKSYLAYLCQHFLCNAHHLRELRFILERYGQPWAYQMSLLLSTILDLVDGAKAKGRTALRPHQLKLLTARYAAILDQGFAANPLPVCPPDAPKKRGRVKRPPPLNLLERLKSKEASVLGFMRDFSIPFDNNQAERDLRMMKLKQKISGCFRTEDGARMFCRIRGYFSTLRKQKVNLLDALVGVFSGSPTPLTPQPE
jgi:transposase